MIKRNTESIRSLFFCFTKSSQHFFQMVNGRKVTVVFLEFGDTQKKILPKLRILQSSSLGVQSTRKKDVCKYARTQKT